MNDFLNWIDKTEIYIPISPWAVIGMILAILIICYIEDDIDD